MILSVYVGGERMDSKSFFFCYDPRLAKHLKFNLGISYITNAKQKNTGNEFWLFPKSDKLQMGIREWRENILNRES